MFHCRLSTVSGVLGWEGDLFLVGDNHKLAFGGVEF